MARKVREEEENIFQLLLINLPEEMLGKISKKTRRIFFSETTYNVVADSHLILSDAIQGIRILLAEYSGNLYICMSRRLFTNNVLALKNEIDSQNDMDLLDGFGILLINRGVIKIQDSISPYKLYDSFFAWMEDREFECSDIFEMFDEYAVFRLEKEEFSLKYKEDLNRILCILMFEKHSQLYGDEFYNNIFGILILESSRSILPMLYSILQTTKSDLIFLQLYRCLEYLYIIQRAVYLGVEYEIELKKVLLLLENEKIRYPEASSIREIVGQYCNESIIKQYYDYLLENLGLQPCKEDNRKEKVSDYIYETRCKIAHFKYGQSEIKDEDTLYQSNILLSRVVKTVFEKLDEKIIRINEELDIWEGIATLIKKT